MTPTETPAPIQQELFPEVVLLRMCTANVCSNGHEWIPKMALAKCGYGTPQGWNGCGAPVLAIKIEACPVCNEPVKKLRLRTDHTPPTPFPSPLCVPGSSTTADVAEIVIDRHPEVIEFEYDKKFPPLGLGVDQKEVTDGI